MNDSRIDINYCVRFYSYWHCGSGLSAGSDVDAVVIKDNYRLPFIPGRTVKGLIKEAVEEIMFLENRWHDYGEMFVDVFGNADDRNYLPEDDNNVLLGRKGNAFFGNVEISEIMKNTIVNEKLQNGLYSQLAFTAIGNDGVAEENSLRQIEVVIPITLHGIIMNVPEEFSELIRRAMKMIKRIGLNRSRGLGRCDMFLVEK